MFHWIGDHGINDTVDVGMCPVCSLLACNLFSCCMLKWLLDNNALYIVCCVAVHYSMIVINDVLVIFQFISDLIKCHS